MRFLSHLGIAPPDRALTREQLDRLALIDRLECDAPHRRDAREDLQTFLWDDLVWELQQRCLLTRCQFDRQLHLTVAGKLALKEAAHAGG